MTLKIRSARVGDAKNIAIARREIAQEPGFLCCLSSEINEESVRFTIESAQGVFLVAEKNGQLVGHVYLDVFQQHSLSHIAILNIAVHKGFQGRGIGTLLLEKIIAWAKQSALIEKIELNVRVTNSRAIALYRKMGFQEEGRLKRRIKVGKEYIDDILMALMIV